MGEIREQVEDNEREEELLFDRIYQEALTRKDNVVEFEGPYSKRDFLEHLVRKYDVVLHGTNNQGILEFEPRQANDADKKSGNQIGVYGTRDAVIPMFYAIKDEKKFRGTAISGFQRETDDKGNLIRETYNFQVEQKMIEEQPWSEGTVYILPGDSFEQVTDDDGKPVNEYVSKTPVNPSAKLKIAPEEFPYINEIKVIEK